MVAWRNSIHHTGATSSSPSVRAAEYYLDFQSEERIVMVQQQQRHTNDAAGQSAGVMRNVPDGG
jgi:hypothetical protein